MKRISKLFAAVLFMCCAGSLSALAEAPVKEEYHIASEEDFRHFVRSCRINTWSDGMTVSLDADLDLRGGEHVGAAAYFNGTFLGNSHRIIKDESQAPLFQTIGADGTVSGLSLSASVKSTRDNTAAFVSENNGTLEGITVEADVSGKETAGILAAVNTETGSITSCEVSGTLSGDSSTGGIAGKNSGSIVSCTNRADINTTVDDSGISGDDIKDIMENVLLTKSINNAENLKTEIDTGGIAGYNLSSGSITDCVNMGTVGYPHYGYNTGGICGRTGGAVEKCENRGNVYGRRGTGGIAGKQQPEITLDFSPDVLSSITDELDDINTLVTDTLNTSEDITDSTYDRLLGLSKSMTDVKNSSNVVYNASLQRFDEVADSVNSSTGAVVGATQDIASDTGMLEDSFDSLSNMTDNIESSIDSLTEAFELTQDQRDNLLSVNRQLRADLNSTSSFVDEVRNGLLPLVPEERQARISEGLASVNRLVADIRAMKTILSGLRSMRDRIADGSLQVESWRRERALSSSVSDILDSMDDLDTAVSCLSAFSSSLGGTLSSAASGININLKKNERVREAGNDIYAGLDSISGQLDSMNIGAREDSLEVLSNLNEINRRFASLTDLMENERDRLNGLADDGGTFVDNSDTVSSTSRIVSCKNEGDIAGDTQTGGIAGSIGVEYDLDPDRDVLRSNDRSLDYTFGVSAAIFDSENNGEVAAKGDHAGGILGKADMGSLRKNRNHGDVSSDEGIFVGGIAGYSEAVLDGNTARCRVSGLKNTGGICGYGTVLRNNLAAVTILETEEYAGSIAGNTDTLEPSDLKNNLYYSGNYGAINNIDYAGMAEKAGEPLDTVLVKFRVNGHSVGTEEVKNGTVLRDVPVPATEEREGFYLKWDTDPDTVITGDIVVDSAYCLPVDALVSPDKLGETSKALLVADGNFRDGDALIFRKEGDGHYFVSIPDDGLTERVIRVLRLSSKKCRLFVNGAEITPGTFGEYMTFRTGERELEIYILEEEPPYRLYAAAGGALAGLILLLILIKLLRKRSSARKAAKAEKAPEAEEKAAEEKKPEAEEKAAEEKAAAGETAAEEKKPEKEPEPEKELEPEKAAGEEEKPGQEKGAAEEKKPEGGKAPASGKKHKGGRSGKKGRSGK